MGLQLAQAFQCRRHKRSGFNPWVERSPGEGNDNPFQYSCLENPMDRGAWRATVHGVKQSWTQLKHAHIEWFRLSVSTLVTGDFKEIDPFLLGCQPYEHKAAHGLALRPGKKGSQGRWSHPSCDWGALADAVRIHFELEVEGMWETLSCHFPLHKCEIDDFFHIHPVSLSCQMDSVQIRSPWVIHI